MVGSKLCVDSLLVESAYLRGLEKVALVINRAGDVGHLILVIDKPWAITVILHLEDKIQIMPLLCLHVDLKRSCLA